MTLYAVWTENPTYTVTYNSNTSAGGTVPTDNGTYEEGTSVTVLGNTGNLVKPGYTFAGWNTAADGNGTTYAAEETFLMGTENVTLYAVWNQQSTNANLNSLSLSEGTLTPGFSSGTTSYTAEVAYDVSNITVTAAVYDSNATLRVNGSSVTSGSATPALTLAEGENTITVEVTAEDGTTKDYTMVVNRAAAPDIVDEDNTETRNGNTGNNQTSTEEITVDVESGKDGTIVATITVKRTKDNDGQIKDEVVLSENSMSETIQKLVAQGNPTASIVIPDTRDEVSEVNVTLPKTALNKLKEGNINLEIKTANAKLSIPAITLAQFDEDIYFRIVPIKDQTEKEQVEERAKLEKIIQEVSANKEIRILGRPAVIETNMQNQIVRVTMPLRKEDLPSNEQDRQQMFNNLVIFIEHSDGTKELVSSEVIAYADSTWDIEFEIEKFSTFSMVHLDGAEQYFAQLEKSMMHQAYIAGYADGTFRPNQDVTRAEMAALLARNLTPTVIGNTEFSDLTRTHWAYDSIGQVVAAGLMKGYPNGQFKPDEVLTRAEMAAIALQWKNLEQLDGSEVFSDTENHWATSIITAVSNDHVMSGYPDGSFKPDQSLSRAEAVTVVNRLLDRGPLNGVEISTWPDVPTHHWAYRSIQEASMSHTSEIIDGVETLVEQVE